MDHRKRRLVGVLIGGLLMIGLASFELIDQAWLSYKIDSSSHNSSSALYLLDQLEIRSAYHDIEYERSYFGDGWIKSGGCDTRNIILNRDLLEVKTNSDCQVVSGTLRDPYSGHTIDFRRGENSSQIQIDHVVALANAWQTGAYLMDYSDRLAFANDYLNLLAVDGVSNQIKSASDASQWLPENEAFHCQYITRQVEVKQKYHLWVTPDEYKVMAKILADCKKLN